MSQINNSLYGTLDIMHPLVLNLFGLGWILWPDRICGGVNSGVQLATGGSSVWRHLCSMTWHPKRCKWLDQVNNIIHFYQSSSGLSSTNTEYFGAGDNAEMSHTVFPKEELKKTKTAMKGNPEKMENGKNDHEHATSPGPLKHSQHNISKVELLN